MRKLYILRIVYCCLGVGCMYVATSMLDSDKDLFTLDPKINPFYLLVSIIFYLLSHSVRVFRLVLISPKPISDIYGLWKEQYKANGVNLLLPFKLGESYRLIFFRRYLGSYSDSFSVLLTERMLDLLVIFFFTSITIYLWKIDFDNVDYIFYGSLCVFLFLLFLYFVLNDFLKIIYRSFLIKPANRINVKVAEVTASIMTSMQSVKVLMREKYASSVFLSLMIWTLEISACILFISVLEGRVELLVLLAVSISLSSLLPNGPAGYGGLQMAFYGVGLIFQNENLVHYSLIYSLYIFGSGLVLAGIFFAYDLIFQREYD